jgi:tyrosyl-tRNA synthetase
MPRFRSEFLNILSARGFIQQVSEAGALDALAAKGTLTAYVGSDATAKSLHVGNLLTTMMLHWLQETGHRPIVLMGGGTSMVGDPSGKDEQRQLLTRTSIDDNITSIKTSFGPFLKFGEGKTDALLVNNADWLLDLNYIEFLRDTGRHFSVNRMLSFDSVKLRLEREQNLSFLEFNYMILQAYDFVELYRRHGCILQMGGNDQWGNIVNGIDLGRRLEDTQLFGLTCPLLTTSSGAKMGKTAAGAVWLNADMMSPYDYWQYWRNTEDADVGRFLKLFTRLPMEEIARLEELQGAELNEAKKTLATQATGLLHGSQAAFEAENTARRTFEEGRIDTNLPTITLTTSELKTGLHAIDAFVRAGLVPSKGEARRQIRGGGLKINDVTLTDEAAIVNDTHLNDNGVIKLSFGKKKHVLLKAIQTSK